MSDVLICDPIPCIILMLGLTALPLKAKSRDDWSPPEVQKLPQVWSSHQTVCPAFLTRKPSSTGMSRSRRDLGKMVTGEEHFYGGSG